MNNPRLHSILILLACIVALGTVLVAQFGFGLQPCHLCVIQRLPYAFAACFALAAIATPKRKCGLMLGVCALCFATNAGFAFFHIGVEQHWWAASCSGTGVLATTGAALLAQLASGPPPPACDALSFSLFGISIAGFNLIASLVLTAFASWAARKASVRHE